MNNGVRACWAMVLVWSAGGWAAGPVAAQDPVPQGFRREEMPVRVFIPQHGYDDNDPIVAVVDVTLPNLCYSISDQEITRDAQTGQIEIKQFALHRTDGFCAEGALMPQHLRMVSSHKQEVMIGHRPQGSYGIKYASAWDDAKGRMVRTTKSYAVGVARTPLEIDESPYAPVERIIVSGVVQVGKPVKVRLAGVLTSACMKLNPNVGVRRDDDVFILKPTVTLVQDLLCHFQQTPFESDEPFSIGVAPKEGRYLIHARSMGGASVNELISSVLTEF